LNPFLAGFACLLLVGHVTGFVHLGNGVHQLRFHQKALPALAPRRAQLKAAHGAQNLEAQIMFADAVEKVLKKKFKSKKMRRVVDSWRRMDREELYSEFLDDVGTVQECNSYIDGLPVKTFWDPYEHEWARRLRDNAKTIQDEFQRVAIDGASELDEKGNNVWATAANSTSAQAYGPSWKTLALMDRCVWDPINVHLFPETTRLLRELQVPCIEAFFARMLPESKINAHSDYCNFALTSHLGLDIPEGECSITVGKDTREWRNGEMLMFDTSLMHEAENRADRMRYILMLRVWHPALAPEEVAGIRYIFDALETPEIVEADLRKLQPELFQPSTPAPTPSRSLDFGPVEGGNRAERRKAKKKSKARPGGGGGFA